MVLWPSMNIHIKVWLYLYQRVFHQEHVRLTLTLRHLGSQWTQRQLSNTNSDHTIHQHEAELTRNASHPITGGYFHTCQWLQSVDWIPRMLELMIATASVIPQASSDLQAFSGPEVLLPSSQEACSVLPRQQCQSVILTIKSNVTARVFVCR